MNIEYAKERVAMLLKSGKRQSEIVADLTAEGIPITRQTVGSLTQRMKETGSMNDKKATGRPCALTNEHVNFIATQMRINDELTSTGT